MAYQYTLVKTCLVSSLFILMGACYSSGDMLIHGGQFSGAGDFVFKTSSAGTSKAVISVPIVFYTNGSCGSGGVQTYSKTINLGAHPALFPSSSYNFSGYFVLYTQGTQSLPATGSVQFTLNYGVGGSSSALCYNYTCGIHCTTTTPAHTIALP